MSKVNDSGDARRMAEMNEAQLRRRADNTKRDTAARLERSFKQVITQRGQRAQAQQTAREAAEDAPNQKLARQVLDKVRQEQPKAPHELARRAAMSRAMHQGISKKADANVDQTQQAETARADDMVVHRDGELEHVDQTARDEQEREVERAEDRQTALEAERQLGDPLAPIGEDPRRRQPRDGQGGGRGRDSQSAQGVEGPKGAGGAQAPQLPPEVLRQIVSAIYKGVSADGRTHIQVTLRGGMMDGVQLSVRSEGGKVTCDFRGCGKDLGRLLDASKGALARGLGKRGLRLERLSAS